MFFINNLDGINPANIGAPKEALVTANVPFVVGEEGIPVTGSTTLSFGFPRVQMQVFVQALRENGLLRVLAEPNLVAINGQPATFLAGGEVPIPITTDERIKIEYKEFGVRLNFTPVVLAEDKIRLKVAPEVSEPDFANSVTFGGVSIPGFATRRVDTVVEIGSGQTFAIGGLLSERVRAISNRVPGLGDLPVLGALFRSVDYQLEESELVVLVTPELVEPVSPDQITYVPGANYVAPNDFELFMLGELSGETEEELPALQPRVNQSWPVRPADLYGPTTAMKLRGPLGPAGSEEGS
jgi:pilus assembly protein CpaC